MPIQVATLPDSVQEGSWIEVDGIRTHYHDAGDGPPLLLLHGSGPGVSSWANWRVVYPPLSQQYRVIAPDQLGFGQTGRPADGRYGREAWTTHAAAFLDALGVTRCSVIGNSMGGAVAFSLAVRRPEAIDKIVAMGSVGVATTLSPGLDLVWGYEPSLENMRRLVELFPYDKSIATDDLVGLRYASSIEPGVQESYAAMFPAPRQRWLDDLALSDDELVGIRRPVLLVHGSDDEVIPFEETSLKLLRKLPDVRCYLIGRCGHWVMIEHPAEFLSAVTAFLGES